MIFTVVIFTFEESIIFSVVTKIRTHLQLPISNFIKQRRLVEEFHHYCISTTYDKYRQFNGSVANAVRKKDSTWSQNSSGKFIQTVGDNFDGKLSTQNDLKQTQSMEFILTQKILSNVIDDSEKVGKLSKKDLQKSQPADLDVIKYKGPVKLTMSNKDAHYQVDSLQMLCQKVLTVSRANDCDLGFLQGISNE